MGSHPPGMGFPGLGFPTPVCLTPHKNFLKHLEREATHDAHFGNMWGKEAAQQLLTYYAFFRSNVCWGRGLEVACAVAVAVGHRVGERKCRQVRCGQREQYCFSDTSVGALQTRKMSANGFDNISGVVSAQNIKKRTL